MRSPILRRLLRTLGRRPGLALTVVATLALGIGANTAIFSVVDAYLLRPLPYPHAERLVEVWDRQPPAERAPASLPELLDWQRSRSFDLLAGSVSMGLTLTGGDLPQRVRATLVTPGYLDLFGTRPLLGRVFTPGEEREGGPRAALLGYELWRDRFGGRPDVVGRVLVLDGKSYEVVGVLGAGVPALGHSPAALWLPLLPNTPWRQEGVHYLTVVGRLRPGVSLAAARAESAAMVRAVDALRHRGHGIELVPLRDHFVGDAAPRLALLLAAVGLVLLIAVANVAALLLARAVERAEELAVRAALGAGRRALLAQGLEESFAYGLLGGIAGLAAGAWGTRALLAMLPADVPRLPGVGVDWRVLAFTAAVSLLVTLLCGLAPAWVGARADARVSLAGARTAGVSRASGRLRQVLVVAQLSLCALLLVGAGLMLHSFQRLRAVDPGFRAHRLLTFQLSLPDSRYGEPARREALFERLLARMAPLPGVRSVALANDLPLTGAGMSGDVTVEGRSEAEPVAVWKWMVSERYFETLGIPLRRGRAFTPQDRTGSQPVTIVSEGLAQRLWPGQEPLGKRLRVLVCGADCWEEVVGVVADTRIDGLDQPAPLAAYSAWRQAVPDAVTVAVRTGDGTPALGEAIRHVVAELDPELPIDRLRSMEEIVAGSVAARRLPTTLLGAFAALALVLAAVGVAGVIAYLVAARRRELGIRLALGATRGSVVALVVGQGVRLLLAGGLLGLLAATALGRFLAGSLYGVSPRDPLAFGGAAAALALAALVGCLIPARRAGQVEPMATLSGE